MSYDFIIVGSGIAGTSAAYQLREKNLLMLDVGNCPENEISLEGNLYDLKKSRESLFDELIGSNYENLHNITNSYLSPKLKSPAMRYVTKDARKLSPVISDNFMAVMSFSMGGLANAWGGGLLRYTSKDLNGFPISVQDLEPYYNILTKLVGITGVHDDLTPFLGTTSGLYPSLEMCAIAKQLYKKYLVNKEYFINRNISIGRSRIAVLSQDHGKRAKYNFSNLELFKSQLSAIYTPAFTLSEMIQKNEIIYKSGYLVEKYIEKNNKVIVYSKNIKSKQIEKFEGKKLILAAGTLNTTKIVLISNNDYESKLPILDNPVSFVPFLNIGMIGSQVDKSSYSGGQMNIIYNGDMFEEPIFIAVYNLTGPLHSEFALNFPLSIMGNQAALKYVLPAILMTQIFYPDNPSNENYIKIGTTGELYINYKQKTLGKLEKYLISSFRKIGFYGLHRWCQYPMPGNSIHYAGTLPMRATPENKYETNSFGCLNGTNHIYIADPSTFPNLTSKHLSFTNMANAMRVAQSALINSCA